MICASPLLIPQHTEGEKSVHERIKEEEEERSSSVLRFESWLFWVVVVVVVKLWWYSRYYEVLFYSGLFFEQYLFSPLKERKKYIIIFGKEYPK